MYGDGMQTRSFQYVSDLVSGLIALMNSNYSQPVNIGNPEEHTIKEFASIINNIVGKSSILLLLLPHPFTLLCGVDISYETPPFNPVLRFLP